MGYHLCIGHKYIYWHLPMVQIQTMTNYDRKKSKVFISLNVLLKEIWNIMICAFSLSRRSYLCFKSICHKLLSQLTTIDWRLTLQIAFQADQLPRPKGSIISTQFSTQSSSPKFLTLHFQQLFLHKKIKLINLSFTNCWHLMYSTHFIKKNLYAIRQRI